MITAEIFVCFVYCFYKMKYFLKPLFFIASEQQISEAGNTLSHNNLSGHMIKQKISYKGNGESNYIKGKIFHFLSDNKAIEYDSESEF